MAHKRYLSGLLLILLLLGVGTRAETAELTRTSINGGGELGMASSNYGFTTTTAQSVIGRSLSDSFHFAIGFWYASTPLLPGAIKGQVTADCPSPGTALLGARVDAFEQGSGDLLGSGATDAAGFYTIDSLREGNYVVTVVTPLGYSAAADEVMALFTSGDTATVDYALSCVEIVAQPRSIGFWKHQVGVALGGKGNAQIEGDTLCAYLDLIEVHFNSNEINQVIVYVPPASGLCADKLQVAKDLLNLKGKSTMTARAKQQLTALLLNVSGGKISLTEIISEDSATVSQAITYADNLIDDPVADHEVAKDICDDINNSILVAAGVIPLTTPDIAYKQVPGSFELSLNYPNPFNPSTSFTLSLPEASEYSIEVFNVVGQRVKSYSGLLDAGVHTVTWDGRNDRGQRVATGVYFYRARASGFEQVRKMLMLK